MMNKSSDTSASSQKSTPSASKEETKKDGLDPHQAIRFINMILAIAMLVFAVWSIFSIFSIDWSQSIIISFLFSIY
jgi:hypothetical protein